MKLWAAALVVAASLFGQPAITLSGPPSVRAGQPITITATLTNGASPTAAGISLAIPSQLTGVTAALNPAITSKTLYCSTGALYCIAMGATAASVNAAAIPDGPLWSWTGTVTPGSTGPLVFAVAPGNGAVQLLSGSQQLVTVTPPVSLSIPIVSACDLNGDGKVDGADLVLLVNWIIGRVTPPAGQTCDVNGDGRCDLADLGVIFTAALGGACITH